MSYDNGFLNAGVIPVRRQNTSKTFASGKFAIAICDRCGRKQDWVDMQTEPGTLLKVCKECNDGMWSWVTHPQNYTGLASGDATALPWSRPDLATGANGLDSTAPYYLATNDGYVIEWNQEMVIELGTSGGPGDRWARVKTYSSPPYGYND